MIKNSSYPSVIRTQQNSNISADSHSPLPRCLVQIGKTKPDSPDL
ncbi:Uncharacterized protein dnm_007380 [Desulfonema magnum]|uniref:Uncharacterized protein n=1 Tax=Desulfonema magnum TaxID=45655 RepID=A0A975BG88_9BACT|nr:Uncharacterized protein dnm_007380 [Desulfonema magnum]